MATATTNTATTSTFSPLLAGLGRYVSDGVKWGGAFGTGVTLTYSFPTSASGRAPGYSEFSTITALNANEMSAVRDALRHISDIARITFTEVADTAATNGDIRFGLTLDTEFAHAYFPGNYPEAGDVWFRTNSWNAGRNAIVKGDYDYSTIIHEVGHALGLKHSFEAPNPIPVAQDNVFYTIMSYTASPLSPRNDNYSSFDATTLMYYDILALQKMYGRNTTHNAGNTTYTFREGQRYFETIDDASGIDTIVYSGRKNSVIDLRDGAASEVSEAIAFTNGSTRGTVFIGPNSVIERATGGTGHDRITGNTANNLLSGLAGNDTLTGDAGADVLIGGLGKDTLTGGAGVDYFNINVAADTGPASASRDVVMDFAHLTDKLNFTGMDASTAIAGDQQFIWRNTGAISTSTHGELRFQQFNLSGDANDYTLVYGDTDGDTAIEFTIELKGLIALSSVDILL